MSNKFRRHLRKTTCNTKSRFPSEADAQRSLVRLTMRSDYDGRLLAVYRCQFHPDHYHVGHIETRMAGERS